MADEAFQIALGGGLYLDSNGVLHKGPLPKLPTYQAPGGPLPFDPDAISKAVGGVGGAIPSITDTEKFAKFRESLGRLGVTDNLIKLLGVISLIASTVSVAFAAVGVALALAKVFGFLKDGPSALEELVKERFDQLDRSVNVLSHQIAAKDLRTQRDGLIPATGAVKDFVSQRDSGTLGHDQFVARSLELRTNLETQSVPYVLNLLDVSTYMEQFDQAGNDKVWPFIGGTLRTDGDNQPAPYPAMNAPVYDHRLALILGAFASNGLLAMIGGISPEFRTTGDFRSIIRECAMRLDALAASMRSTSLARTVLTEANFFRPVPDSVTMPGPFGTTTLAPTCGLWPVGALDLCAQDNTFFTDILYAFGTFTLTTSPVLDPTPAPLRRGNLDFRWLPPAILDGGSPEPIVQHADGSPILDYQVLNAKACADAANAQSASDYADLLISSGYVHLAQLSALLRHAATQPDQSETVRGGFISLRRMGQAVDFTVHSDPIPFTGVIDSPARRQPRQVRAIGSFSTQPLLRETMIGYRILLRTLASRVPPNHWIDPTYDSVQTTSYQNDPHNPGFTTLGLETSTAAIVGELELVQGNSPAEPLRGEGTAELQADTFEWWIPVDPTPTPRDRADVGVGGPIRKPPIIGRGARGRFGPVPLDDPSQWEPGVFAGIGWAAGDRDWTGVERETARSTVHLNYTWEWAGSEFRIELENVPDEGNYVVFVVVEETFGSIEPDDPPGKPKVLHTAFKVPIDGRLTFVPKGFFAAEQAARDKANSIFGNLADRYVVADAPGPEDPLMSSIRPGDLATSEGQQRLIAAARKHVPDLLRRVVSDHLGAIDQGIQPPDR